jgi:hypothetical protein
MGRITNLTIADSGDGNYTFLPYVVISDPDQDSRNAGGLINLTDSGSIGSITITDSGNYYTSTPTVRVSANILTPQNYITDPKFGVYGYGLGITLIDSDLTSDWDYNFGTPGSTDSTDLSFSFFVKVPSTHTGSTTIIRFKTFDDVNGDDNEINFIGGQLQWKWSEQNGLSSHSMLSGSSYNDSSYHFIQLIKDYQNPNNVFKMYVDGAQASADQTRPQAYSDPFFTESITLVNSEGNNHIVLDELEFKNNPSVLAIPTGMANVTINYENFELDSASVTATVTDGQVTAFNIINKGRYMDSATLIVDDPTGTPADFRGAAYALIDSNAGKVSDLIITDSGNFYDNAPTVSILGGILADSTYERGDDITQTLSNGVKIRGEVLSYALDSDGDSARYLYVGHVGADDGNFREFVVNRQVLNVTKSATTGLEVISVEQENRMSENEQNDDFTDTTIDDFLNFSEDNPFGDPENQ